MSTQPKNYITPEQHLEIERKADFKSEYHPGGMFAQWGARVPHVLVTVNASGELRQQLRKRPCTVFASDMRVRVTPAGLYTYPDVVIVCGEPRFLDNSFDTLVNPTVIIEVLSESTEAYDRGGKFELYRGVESLAEYVMISSQRISVERYTRLPGGDWKLSAENTLEDALDLQSVDCHLLLADLYVKVEFLPSGPSMRQLVL